MADGRRDSIRSRLVALALAAALAVILWGAVTEAPPRVGARLERSAEFAASLQELFSDLAERVRPAVVSIGSSELVDRGTGETELFHRLFNDQAPGRRRVSIGSGVIVDRRGYILTNSHVLGDGTDLRVRLWNNRKLSARVVQRNDALDIGLIKVEHENLVAAPLGGSDDVRVGHWVIAVGNPFGLSHSVSVGIISAVGRSDLGILSHESFIQTDASIHQGNSGGPLVDLNGRVVGINTAIYANSSGANLGIGFAIPISLVKAFIDKWIDGKNAAFLGVTFVNVDSDIASYFGLPHVGGVFVSRVEDDSPARMAGFHEKDIIRVFNGVAVRSAEHLRALIAQSETGSPLPIEIVREGREETLTPTLVQDTTRPLSGGTAEDAALAGFDGSKKLLGITVSPLSRDLVGRLGLPADSQGIVVLEVEHESPADSKGLRVSDVIIEVNDRAVSTIQDFREALESATRGIMLKVERGGRPAGYVFLGPAL